ncbi:MAG: alginate lyase family protein [Chloroflexales bacterium]|nr:alginate lyase family protein [Chloroflexales bacterium]
MRTLLILLCALIISLPASPTLAGTPSSSVHLNDTELTRIKADYQARPSFYQRIMDDAHYYLNKTEDYSVTFNGGLDNRDPHYFMSVGSYYGCPTDASGALILSECPSIAKDYNLDDERAELVAGAVYSLGMAYQLTGEQQYAERAAEFIRVWAINPQTRMYPTFTNLPTNGSKLVETANHYSGLGISTSLSLFVYGADLIKDYPGWREKAAFKAWVAEFGRNMFDLSTYAKGEVPLMNHGHWYVAFMASLAAYTEDRTLLDKTYAQFNIQLTGIDTDGSIKSDRNSQRGLHYSAKSIGALFSAAEALQHHGYRVFETHEQVLRKTLDFHLPFLKNPRDFPYNTNDPIYHFGDLVNALFLGFYNYGDQRYYDAATTAPGYSIYSMFEGTGRSGITHGRWGNGSVEVDPAPSPPPPSIGTCDAPTRVSVPAGQRWYASQNGITNLAALKLQRDEGSNWVNVAINTNREYRWSLQLPAAPDWYHHNHPEDFYLYGNDEGAFSFRYCTDQPLDTTPPLPSDSTCDTPTRVSVPAGQRWYASQNGFTDPSALKLQLDEGSNWANVAIYNGRKYRWSLQLPVAPDWYHHNRTEDFYLYGNDERAFSFRYCTQ